MGATQFLIGQFAAAGAKEIYVDKKAKILPAGELSEQMTFNVARSDYTALVAQRTMHDNHFHVRFPDNYGPIGDVEFAPASLVLPVLTFPVKATKEERDAIVEANAVTITTNIIRDVNGFALFKGYPVYVSVRDVNDPKVGRGTLVGKHKNNSYWIDEGGRLTLKFTASTSAGDAILQLWVDQKRTKPLGKPLAIHFSAPN